MSPIAPASRQHPAEGASPPLSLLLDIPREIVPNISSRLPGPDLLRFARVCKQIPIHDKQILLKQWASRELLDIAGLSGEQLWTRFLALATNCGNMIEDHEWNAFLATINTRQPEDCKLLELAVFSPRVIRASDGLGRRTDVNVFEMAAAEAVSLRKLCDRAGTAEWAAEAAAAVITGQWHLLSTFCADAAALLLSHDVEDRPLVRSRLNSIVHSFSRLPLESQIQNLFSLGRGRDTVSIFFKAFCGLFNAVVFKWIDRIAEPQYRCGLLKAQAPFFLFLNEIYRSSGSIGRDTHSLKTIADFVADNLASETHIGPWRDQAPGLALCLFLTLQWNREQNGANPGFRDSLITGGFITRREYSHFCASVAKGTRDSFTQIQDWLASSRVEKPESSCAIS